MAWKPDPDYKPNPFFLYEARYRHIDGWVSRPVVYPQRHYPEDIRSRELRTRYTKSYFDDLLRPTDRE